MNLRWLPSDSVEVNFNADITNDSSEAGADVLRRAVQLQTPDRPRPIRDTSGWTTAIRTRLRPFRWTAASCRMARTAAIPMAGQSVPELRHLHRLDRAHQRSGPSSRWWCRWCSSSTSTACRPTSTGRSTTTFSLKSISAWRKYESSWAQDVDDSPAASQQLLQSLRHWAWSQELRLNGSIRRCVRLHGRRVLLQAGRHARGARRSELRRHRLHPRPGSDALGFDRPCSCRPSFHFTDDLDLSRGRALHGRREVIHLPSSQSRMAPSRRPARASRSRRPSRRTACSGDSAAGRSLDGFTPEPFTSDQFDWRVALDYQFTDDLMAYVNVSTGYKGGGINPRPFYLSQVLRLRSRDAHDLRNRLQVRLRRQSRTRQPGRVLQQVRGHHPATQRLPDGHRGAAYALPAARERRFGGREGRRARDQHAAGRRLLGRPRGKLDGLPVHGDGLRENGHSGLRSSRRSRRSSRAASACSGRRHSRATTPSSPASTGRTVGRSTATHSTTRTTTSRALWLGNLRLTWRGPEDKWEASAEVQNVTDKLYYLATNDYSASAGTSSYSPGLPRTWALTVKRTFE